MRKYKWKEIMPYALLAGVMFLYHIFIHIHKMDDVAIYGDLLDYTPLLPWLEYRYQTWSSRILIDGLIVLFVEYNPWIWKLLNIGCWLLLAHSVIRLCGCKDDLELKYITVFLILIYPIFTMGSAGWCATQLNYLWPLSIGSFALTSIKYSGGDNPPSLHWSLYLIYPAATVFACSQEQMCAAILAVLAAYLVLHTIKNGIPRHAVLLGSQLLLSAAQLLFILTSPGNQARKWIEVERWMPDYPLLSFRDKLYIGFTDTMERVAFQENNYLFLIFVSVLSALVFQRAKTLLLRLFALALPAAVIAGTYFLHHEQRTVPYYLLIILCLIISFMIVCDNRQDFLVYGVVLGSGFAGRVAVGYSPSIYVSGDRTCLFLYGAVIFCTIKLLYDHKESHPKFLRTVCLLTGAVSLYCVAETLNEFIKRSLP